MTSSSQSAHNHRTRNLADLTQLPDDALISSTETATMCGRTPETLRRWRHKGIGPRSLRHPVWPDRVEYLASDVRAWIASRREV